MAAVAELGGRWGVHFSENALNSQASTTSNKEPAAPADGPSDIDLVGRCQQGDTGAFNELITRHRQRCFAMIFHMVRNEEDAWDLAQDGFVRAWKSIANFRGQSAFYTWLHRIMTNAALDWLRKKQIQGGQEFDDTIGLRRKKNSDLFKF